MDQPVDPRILDAVKTPGSQLLVVVRPLKGRIIPEASKEAQRHEFEGLGVIDSPAHGNMGRAVYVRSYHKPTYIGVFWLSELHIPAGPVY